MKAAPNLNFTVVKPEQNSLNGFVQMLKTVYQNFIQILNGNIGFGDGTNLDNINGSWINVVAPVGANTDFTVNHNLGRLPVGYLVMQKDRACDVYTGSVGATSTQLTLRATVASAILRLFIVSLLLCFFTQRSYAQGARLDGIAQIAINTSIGSGIAKVVPSAVITVCTGSVAPPSGSVCTSTTPIFSNTALTASVTNPTNADVNGNYFFCVPAGQNYVISISGVGITAYSFVWTAPYTSGSSFSPSGNIPFTGDNTHSGKETFTGLLNCKNIEGVQCVDSTLSRGGSDIGAELNLAYAALPAHGGVIWLFPNPNDNVYNFSTPIVFATT